MKRNSRATRQRLLWAAFQEFHRVGFHAADMERILRRAGVTKGALYYHFEGKRALGYAVVEEVLRDWILDRWLSPLMDEIDPLAAMADLARWGERAAQPQGLSAGCPLNNLAQELCGCDEGFHQRLEAIYEEWRAGLAQLLVNAQQVGIVRPEVDARAAATFIIGAWEGSIGLAKAHSTSETLRYCRQGLESYLETLRLPESGRRERFERVVGPVY